MAVWWGCMTARAQEDARITVRKAAAEQNPSLFIRSRCPAELEGLLKRMLAYSDWFSVVGEPSSARYLLEATVAGETLALELSEGGVVRTRVTVPARSWERAARQGVDQLIQAVFGVPGICRSRLAFAVAQGGRKEIFTCPFDGGNFRQLSHNGTISTEPKWGVGGNRLVYTLYQGNRTQIMYLDAAAIRQRRLAAYPGLNSGAALSPDGRRAVLCLSRNGRVDLHLLDLASGGLRPLTDSVAVESSPGWSPDGRRLCYVSDEAGRPQVYILSLVDGRSRRLLGEPIETVSPDWSAVSGRICFAARQAGQYVLAYADPDLPNPEKVVFAQQPGDWESPSWGPDGRHVVCTRQLGGGRELCIVDSWYGSVIRLTVPGAYSLPDWSGLLPEM